MNEDQNKLIEMMSAETLISFIGDLGNRKANESYEIYVSVARRIYDIKATGKMKDRELAKEIVTLFATIDASRPT